MEPERAALRDAVGEARDGCDGSRGGFEGALAGRGVVFRANVASTGRMQGYSFSREGWVDGSGEQVWLPASKVGKELRWGQLEADLGARREPARQCEAGRLVSEQRDAREVAALVTQSFPQPLQLPAPGRGRTTPAPWGARTEGRRRGDRPRR